MNPSPARRIVTGHDEQASAVVLSDGPVPNVNQNPKSGQIVSAVWCTDRMPAEIAAGVDVEDMGLRTLGRNPPPGGTRFAIIDLPPQSRGETHRTDTIDYLIIMSGEVDMVSDESTVHLKAGDVIVQRGANHAWVNSTNEWVRLSMIKIDATPLPIRHG